MDCKHKIAILMATYNGKRYLEKQIESIIWQDFDDWELFIHDDKSTDGTLDIIEKYVRLYPEKIHFMEDCIEQGRGARDSFMWLLEHVESEYYMFSDQDDVWLPHKISITYNRICREEEKTPFLPIMVYTDLCVADNNCFPTRLSLFQMMKMKPKWFDSFECYRVTNKCSGCTSIINYRVKQCAFPIHPHAYMHDWWIALMAWKNGGRCVSIDVPTLLYRQHISNVCGAPVYGRMNWWRTKLMSIRRVYTDNLFLYRFMKDATDCTMAEYMNAKLHVLLYRLFLR